MNKIQKLRHIIEYDGPNEVSVRRIDNENYRVGYCCQCGSCCRNLDIQSRVSNNVVKWLEEYGIKVTKLEGIYHTDENSDFIFTAMLSIPVACKHLEKIEEGKYKCTNYKNRPVICIGYPKSQSKWPTCTYVFLTDEEVNWFTKEYEKYWRGKDGKKKIRMYS